MPLGSGDKKNSLLFKLEPAGISTGLEVSGYVEDSVGHQGFLGVPSAPAQLWSGHGPVGGSQVLEIWVVAHRPLRFAQRGAKTCNLGTWGRWPAAALRSLVDPLVSAPRDPCPSHCPGTQLLITSLYPGGRRFKGAYRGSGFSGFGKEGCTGISGTETNLEEMEEGIPTARVQGRVSGSRPGTGVSEPGLGGVNPTCL